jgi:hypothetical protein
MTLGLDRVHHQADVPGGTQQAAVDGVDADPFLRVGLGYTGVQPVAEDRSKLLVNQLPVAPLDARRPLRPARRIAIEVDRAGMLPPILNDLPADRRRR